MTDGEHRIDIEALPLAAGRAGGNQSAPRGRRRIQLVLIAPEDGVILSEQGLTALRRARIQRLCRQAEEQGGVLTFEDLVHLLSTSLSTLKRDLAALERRGVSVPLYRRRGKRPRGLGLILAFGFLSSARPAPAQISSVFGSVSLEYQDQEQTFDGLSASRTSFSQQFNLGVNGRILDPRLVNFSLSSAYGNSSFRGFDTTSNSFSGTLSLLQGKPYGLTLKHSEASTTGLTDIDQDSSGATLRLTYPKLPQILMDYNRLRLESHGDTRSDLTFTTGSVRLSQRFQTGVIDGEFGTRGTEDRINGLSEHRSFARTSSSFNLSPATYIRFTADEETHKNESLLHSSVSLANRPDPSLSRSLSLGYVDRESAGQVTRATDVSGALFRAFSFRSHPWLAASASTSAFGVFADPAGDSQGWNVGGSATVSYFRPVVFLADYGFTLLYQQDQDDPLGKAQQAHVSAAGRSQGGVRLSADYFVNVQDAATDFRRSFVVGQAEVLLASRLVLRSFAAELTEESHAAGPPPLDSEQRTLTMGSGCSYRASTRLTLDLSANINRRETPSTAATTFQEHAGINYVLPLTGRPALNVIALRERSSQDDENHIEIRSRLSYAFARVNLVMEHRFESTERLGRAAQANSILISLVRRFWRSF